MNYGTLLAYVTVNVQNDFILSELQQRLFQRCNSIPAAHSDELIE